MVILFRLHLVMIVYIIMSNNQFNFAYTCTVFRRYVTCAISPTGIRYCYEFNTFKFRFLLNLGIWIGIVNVLTKKRLNKEQNRPDVIQQKNPRRIKQDPSPRNHTSNPNILTFSSAQEQSETTRRTRRPSVHLKKAMLPACRWTVFWLLLQSLFIAFSLSVNSWKALLSDKMFIDLKTCWRFSP